MNESCVELIRRLSEAAGPSGFEDEVLAVVREAVPFIGRIEEDSLRNLYLYRKEHAGNKPVLMLDAHADEVGMMVQAVKPNGTLRFLEIGGIAYGSLPSAAVRVRNALGEYIPGVVAMKPPHFMGKDEKLQFDGQSLVIDIGATSREEAEEVFHIRIGEPVVPATRCTFDEKNGLFFGKAFDDRIGVAALIETLRRLDGKDLPCDVVGVISSQEEVGDRGARVAVRRVKPDVALCFEGCPADDTFTEDYLIQTALKKGPMIRHMDRSIICNPRYQRWTMDLAEREGIPLQTAVRAGGGNNGAVINLADHGVPVIVAGIPVRYIHSMNCIAAYQDFDAAAALACAVAEKMTREQIEAF
ncbi:MAG: M42 family peptidase [Lachnospiraceae bacterium]|nr:M42 family peptidase [Lachnospiraceae bacterium]